MNAETKAKLIRLRQNARLYVESKLYIKTKDAQIVKLKLNASQQRLYGVIDEQRQAGKPVRVIVLKARQIGFSTLIEALIFHATALFKNISSLIVAHDDDSSRGIFEMSRLFYEMLPPMLRPMKRNLNEKRLLFENPTVNLREKDRDPGLRSQIAVETAGNKSAGRSKTVRNLHCSEVAFWPNAKETLLSLLQAVPDKPGTMIVLESTANGVGDEFYERYWAAKRGDSEYVAVFVPWFEHEEYRRMVDAGFTLTGEEQRLKILYHLDDEQLSWRRWAIVNKCGGDVELFKQEYPSNDVEAFITSGRPVFDGQKLTTMLEHATDPETIGGLVEREGKIAFEAQEKGYLRLWKQPEKDHAYVIGVDVAGEDEGGDHSCADVIDRKTLEQVAQFHGDIDPDLYGQHLERLAKWYNRAGLGIEDNNHGLTTITACKRYSRLYMREVLDEKTKKATKKMGWHTDMKSRPILIDELKKAIREGAVTVHCRQTVEELMTFVVKNNGREEHQNGCHDDRVFSLGIALQMNILMPRWSIGTRREEHYEPVNPWTGR